MAAIEKRGSGSAHWQDLDRDHYLHPFTDHKDLHERRARIITRAEGCYIYDADGNRILDGMSGLWCVNAGYGREELVEAAAAQMRELPYYNSFFQCAHPPSIELAAKLTELSQPQLNHVFFAGSGSESNDTIVRMVRRYWDLMKKPLLTRLLNRLIQEVHQTKLTRQQHVMFRLASLATLVETAAALPAKIATASQTRLSEERATSLQLCARVNAALCAQEAYAIVADVLYGSGRWSAAEADEIVVSTGFDYAASQVGLLADMDSLRATL